MKETDQLRKLMESIEQVYHPVVENDDEDEYEMPDEDAMMFDHNEDIAVVLSTIADELRKFGINMIVDDDTGGDYYLAKIVR